MTFSTKRLAQEYLDAAANIADEARHTSPEQLEASASLALLCFRIQRDIMNIDDAEKFEELWKVSKNEMDAYLADLNNY